MLRIWRTGSHIYRDELGYFLILPVPSMMDSRHSPGTPLIRVGDIYATTFLSESDLGKMSPQPGSVITVVLVSGGVYRIIGPGPDALEDISSWIDLSDFEIIDNLRSLGPRPAHPELIVEPEIKDIRAILGDAVPEGAPEREAIIAEGIGEAGKRREKENGERKRLFGLSGYGIIKRSMERLSRIAGTSPRSFSALYSLLFPGRRAMHRPGSAAGSGGRPTTIRVIKKPGIWWSALTKVLRISGLWRVFTGRQGRYLQKMIEMFEQSDLHNALRHAIPLTNAGDMIPAIPSWGLPRPRTELAIRYQRSRAASSIYTGDHLFSHLKMLYERAFERLDREGKTGEAAFVLAELVQDGARAVSYLERKGKLKEAAELAESRDLPPGLIVRQWFIAGEITRAVAIARQKGAFSDAVLLLERNHVEKARMLRLVWGKLLAQSGDYERAVNVVWPVEESRHVAGRWIEQAIHFGGTVGARMLAKRLSLMPGAFDETKKSVMELMDSENTWDADSRVAFADALSGGPPSPAARALGRVVFRALLHDRAHNKNHWTKSEFESLMSFTDDASLKSDFKAVSSISFTAGPQRLCAAKNPVEYAFADSGTMAIRDVCALSGDRLLVALGEAGVLLINSRGKTLKHFNVPASYLVISDWRNRAIAIAERGDYFRLSKICIDEYRSEFWHETRFDRFASGFDGSTWFIAVDKTLLAADVHSERFKALWRVSNLPGTIISLARSRENVSLLIRGDGENESRRYETGDSITLRMRSAVDADPDSSDGGGISPDGMVNLLYQGAAFNGAGHTFCHIREQGGRQVSRATVNMPSDSLLSVECSDTWLAVSANCADGIHVSLIDSAENRIRVNVRFPRSDGLHIRLSDNELICCDGCGRIVQLELKYGRLLRNLRL
jgi:hypothetical protein